MNAVQLATVGGVGAIVTLLLSSGEKVKDLFSKFQSIWMDTLTLDTTTSRAVYRYCMDEMKMIDWRQRFYNSCPVILNKSTKEKLVTFDVLMKSKVWFRKGWRILSLAEGQWEETAFGTFDRAVTVLLPRWIWSAEKFIKDSVNYYNTLEIAEVHRKRFGIIKFFGKNKNAPEIVMDAQKRPNKTFSGARALIYETNYGRASLLDYTVGDIVLDDSFERSPFEWYAFPDNVMTIVEDSRSWYKERLWYQEKHIPWRRGLLIYGKPGTGKSLLVKCIAQDLDIPIFAFDLASMNNQEFSSYWSEALVSSPCMILFEDFDAVFHGRKAQSKDGLTFDCVLRCISGIETSSGVYLTITTNHIEHIDDAVGAVHAEGKVSSRPGRIDDVIELKEMDAYCRTIMAGRILGLVDGSLTELVKKTEGMTAAQFIEVCNQTALMSKGKVVAPQVVTEEHAVFEVQHKG